VQIASVYSYLCVWPNIGKHTYLLNNSHAAAGALLAAGRTKCRIYSAPREGPWMGLITLSQNRRKQQLRVAAKQKIHGQTLPNKQDDQ